MTSRTESTVPLWLFLSITQIDMLGLFWVTGIMAKLLWYVVLVLGFRKYLLMNPKKVAYFKVVRNNRRCNLINILTGIGLECQKACQQNPACVIFQYSKFNGNCDLKSSTTGSNTTDTNMLIGPQECDFVKSKNLFNFSQFIGNVKLWAKRTNLKTFLIFLCYDYHDTLLCIFFFTISYFYILCSTYCCLFNFLAYWLNYSLF